VSRARGRRTAGALALVVGLAASAAAHWEPPEAIVAELNADATRARLGIERAERDANVPRLLVIRVGARWYALPEMVRRALAEDWHERWKHNVPQGVVSIVDAASDLPAVRFGPGGQVAGVENTPPR
jgi:hypothetical protein